ncbi:hydantoinase B/oxoprolinase family protein [uncultured Roseibium sp.]|uniref:hydantoinase B/oxoprolinase family protein n=1 Tax=uncultured Roseibium sp. TaxID=1936171 RepID=UPI00321631A0
MKPDFRTRGIFGEAAANSRIVVRDKDGEHALAGKSTTLVKAGSVVIMETAGGGGWGAK